MTSMGSPSSCKSFLSAGEEILKVSLRLWIISSSPFPSLNLPENCGEALTLQQRVMLAGDPQI